MKKPIRLIRGLLEAPLRSPATRSAVAAIAGITLVLPAAAASVSIDWVTVGNAGNAADARVMTTDFTTGYGSVGYAYKIAKNETTIGDYTQFLNAVAESDSYALYNPSMAAEVYIAGISRSGSSGSYSYSAVAGTEDKPITFVSWFDAARYCNWLQNGQGSGSTETGAYTLNGAMSGIYTVNPGAQFWIPSENEWYKAAYYDATKDGTGGYWLYPNRADTLPGNTIGVAGSANYYDGDYVGYPGMALTNVGVYGANSTSHYGTNDQGGSVWEWNDAVVSGSERGMRGGPWYGIDASLQSSYRVNFDPAFEYNGVGFRVAGSVSAVPEPTSMLGTLVFVASGLLLRRRA